MTIKAIYDFQHHKDLSELLQVVEEVSQGEWEGMQKKTRSTEPSKYQNPFQVIFDNRRQNRLKNRVPFLAIMHLEKA